MQDLAALERRACRCCRGDDAVLVADDDLTVRADVDQQSRDRFPGDPRRDDVGDDVGTDVGTDRREQHEASFRVDRDTGVGSAQILWLQERRGERRLADRLGVDAEQQVQHRRVAGSDDLQDLLAVHARRRAHAAEQSVDRLDDRGPEFLQRFAAVHLGVAHARQHVGAERRLAIDRGFHGCRRPRAKIHEGRHDRRGPHVDRDAEQSIGRVTGFDVDEAVPHHRRGDHRGFLVIDRERQLREHARRMRDLEPLVDERVGDPPQPAARVLERRRRPA